MNLIQLVNPARGFFLQRDSRGGDGFDGSTWTMKLFKYLAGFMMVSSLLSGFFQLFGSPIHCHFPFQVSFDHKLLETYCWMEGLHIVVFRNEFLAGHPHGRVSNAPFLGIQQNFKHHGDQVGSKSFVYYQWIPMIMFLQGLASYLPYKLWKLSEGNRFRKLALKDPMNGKKELLPPEELTRRLEEKRLQLQYVFAKYLMSIVVGIISLVLQMYFVDMVLGGNKIFWQYGLFLASLSTLFETRNSTVEVLNPMTFTFPKVTKCSFSFWASNGQLQNVDGTCILPLNVWNEKVYAFIWFATWGLIIWCSICLICYFFLKISPKIRVAVFRLLHVWRSNGNYSKLPGIYNVSQWFALNIFAKNMEEDNLREMMRIGIQASSHPTHARSDQDTSIKKLNDSGYSI